MCLHTDKAGGEPKKRNTIFVAVAKTLEITQAEEDLCSLKVKVKGGFLHGVSAIPMKSTAQEVGKTTVKKFRLSRVAQRFVQEREKKGRMLGVIRRTGEHD